MKIDYKKNWDNSGTCYRQTITCDLWIIQAFNTLLTHKKAEVQENFKEKHCYSDNDLKIIDMNYLEKGVNFTNLNQLDLFMGLIYNIKDTYKLNYKRLLWCNTIIIGV